MKIQGIQNQIQYNKASLAKKNEAKTSPFRGNNFAQLPLGNIYGAKINRTVSFGAYAGQKNPANNFYYVLTGKKEIQDIDINPQNIYVGAHNPHKKWIGGVKPSDILKMDTNEAIEMLVKMNTNGAKQIPDNIPTPNFGDNWGRHANYIELNSRALGKMENDRCQEGILGSIKMLNLIPPSASNWANCVILSQIYPNIYGDGYNKPQWEENSLYTIKIDPWFNYGLSENLTVNSMKRGDVEVNPHEQVKTFNDLAHLKGLKTGFRTLLSEDQIKIGYGEQFRWSNPEHLEKFIDMCVNAVDMGFDAIYFDSAKHVGGYDWEHYAGVGATPSYEQMQYITSSIRQRTGRNDLSFIGEKCDDNINHFKNMGLNSGTDYGRVEDIRDIKHNSKRFGYSREYAPGVEVSNDNDMGELRYEQRLNRINSCLFGFDNPAEKLPTFMQMNDLFPLNHNTNTHMLMLHNPRFSENADPNEHWSNLFAEDYDAQVYTQRANELFAYAIK